ncbi:glycosyltransferase [Clostridium gasigenes]|uniref:Glycosyltransferase, GT2 family n=1 Tax=Clostridium gasigenes TaxID=94869 RepID=A0A1H0L9S5_9CLOT|nr:glycosyltransferase [Clostridium gasigenes]SDO64822.1 Glycosyltransferase, GT2 family [Clostridium gasigenes]
MKGYIAPTMESQEFIKDYDYEANNESMKFTSIIILTYNQLNFTKLCIESIRKFTPLENYEIIVVDNNSTDDTVEWLENQENLKVIYNKENKGFPAGCNQGMVISKGDNLLLLNNDTIVTPNWLNNLQMALYSSNDIGAVGCISNNCSNFQEIQVNYTNISEMLEFSTKINVSTPSAWDYRLKLIGYCYMIKREVLDKIGLLDERFTPGNYEDDDLSLRILSEGYKLFLCKDTFIHHFGSVSFANEGSIFSQVLFNNKIKIQEKWGFDTNYHERVKSGIIGLIDSDLMESFNVLDVGCGIGGTLLEINNKYRNANLYGIETSEAVAKVAKGVCSVLVGDIEKLELPYKTKFFDYILLADMLEYVIDPWELIKKMKKYLKKDGYILANLPNIMHVSVLKNIINGRFKYEDIGILNKTHIRFFTLAEIEELFNFASYEVTSITANPLELSPSDSTLIHALCALGNENLRHQYSIYQYIVKAKNKLDLTRYENDDMVNLKFKLMRLDNNIDLNKSLEYIFDMYNKYKEDFVDDIDYLVANHIINKKQVKDMVVAELLKRNINILLE